MGEELYDEDHGEATDSTSSNEKESHHLKKLENDLDGKWKEALAQIDYGFDLGTSTIFVFGEIGDGSLYDLILRIRAILHMRGEDRKDESINLVINSDGGDVYEALGMIDYIQSLSVRVNTICRGRAMSAAALLLCSGTGIRAASKNSTVMFHEISSGIYGKSSDMKANMVHMEKLEDILLELITSNTKKERRFWKDKTVKDYYLTPDEALDLGVIDTIIPTTFTRE